MTEHEARFERWLREHRSGERVVTEAEVRATHRFVGINVASGRIQEGVARCSCGARWFDDADDCPTMEAELDALR